MHVPQVRGSLAAVAALPADQGTPARSRQWVRQIVRRTDRGSSMHKLKIVPVWLTLTVLCLGGCSTYNARPAFKVGKQAHVVYVDEPIPSSELPGGVYRVADSQVIVSGHQRDSGGVGLGLLFGVPGLITGAITDEVRNYQVGKNLVARGGNELQVKLNERARTLTTELLATLPPGKVNTLVAEGGSQVRVTPSVILNFSHNRAYARPYIWLHVGLQPPGLQQVVWKSNYFASNGPARKIEDWTANGGAELKRNLEESLREAITIMLSDVSTPFVRDPAKVKAIKIDYPHLPDATDFKVYVLGEDDRYVYVMPKINDAWEMTGVHAVDKYMIEYYTKTGRFSPQGTEAAEAAAAGSSP